MRLAGLFTRPQVGEQEAPPQEQAPHARTSPRSPSLNRRRRRR